MTATLFLPYPKGRTVIEEKCDSCGALNPGLEVTVAEKYGNGYRMLDVCSLRCAIDVLVIDAAKDEDVPIRDVRVEPLPAPALTEAQSPALTPSQCARLSHVRNGRRRRNPLYPGSQAMTVLDFFKKRHQKDASIGIHVSKVVESLNISQNSISAVICTLYQGGYLARLAKGVYRYEPETEPEQSSNVDAASSSPIAERAGATHAE